MATSCFVFDGFGESAAGDIVNPDARGLGAVIAFAIRIDAVVEEEDFFTVGRIAAIACVSVEEELFVLGWVERFFDQAIGCPTSVVAVAANEENRFRGVDVFENTSFGVKGDLLRSSTEDGHTENLP